MPESRQPDQRGQRPVDDRGDRHDRQALVAGEQHLGLVGDRQVRPAGGDLADRRRRVGGDLGLDVEPRLVEVAAVLRRVDPGVVGVDVEVELDVERLRPAVPVAPRLLAAAGGEPRQRDGAATTSGDAGLGASSIRLRVAATSTTRRSISVSGANSAIAIADRTTTAANTRAVSSCPWAIGSGARAPSQSPPLAEDGSDHRDATAIFAPLKMNGIAAAPRRAQGVRHGPASRVRIIRSRSGSTERSPSSVLTVIGKKQISAMIASFGPIPKPNQTTRIGAIAMIGIVCEATSSG